MTFEVASLKAHIPTVSYMLTENGWVTLKSMILRCPLWVQRPPVQLSVATATPSHSRPPCLGSGEVHSLLRCLSQSELHADHSLQSPQPPSTGGSHTNVLSHPSSAQTNKALFFPPFITLMFICLPTDWNLGANILKTQDEHVLSLFLNHFLSLESKSQDYIFYNHWKNVLPKQVKQCKI